LLFTHVNSKRWNVPYQIDRPALDDFLSRQADLIERAPMPASLDALAFACDAEDGLPLDELRAVWLGAGLATRIGLALVEEPERFIRATAPIN
jgi:hypothetical protein